MRPHRNLARPGGSPHLGAGGATSEPSQLNGLSCSGRLEVASVRLIVAHPGEAVRQARVARHVRTSDGMKTVLVVEDNRDIREMTAVVLSQAGYDVQEAANGAEALSVLATIDSPCLVLLDLMMPVMDGRTFLARLGAESKHADVLAVVVVSATVDEKIDGASRVVRKPASPELLRQIVLELCGPPSRRSAELVTGPASA